MFATTTSSSLKSSNINNPASQQQQQQSLTTGGTTTTTTITDPFDMQKEVFKKEPMFPWYCTASFATQQQSNDSLQQISSPKADDDEDIDDDVTKDVEMRMNQLSSLSSSSSIDFVDNKNAVIFQGQKILDLSTSSDWMESIEQLEQRGNDGAGAYDSMRCDLQLSSTSEWKLWGTDFHLQRLAQSYSSFAKTTTENNNDDAIIQQAMQKSRLLMNALLEKAQSKLQIDMPEQAATLEHGETLIYLVRLTLLWSTPNNATTNNTITDNDIIVRGHVCCDLKPIVMSKPPKPIVVTLATSKRENNDNDIEDDNVTKEDDISSSSLKTMKRPNRHEDADATTKVASWCRERKAYQDPIRYKPPGVGEVLLCKPHNNDDDDDEVVLEGLSSNVFCIYKDGTLKTATDGVLLGYARHLVLDAARRVDGLKVDLQNPILLSQVQDWSEVFITSSSRLVYPIRRIVLPNNNNNNEMIDKEGEDYLDSSFETFWEASPPQEGTDPKWKLLLNEILKTKGYNPIP